MMRPGSFAEVGSGQRMKKLLRISISKEWALWWSPLSFVSPNNLQIVSFSVVQNLKCKWEQRCLWTSELLRANKVELLHHRQPINKPCLLVKILGLNMPLSAKVIDLGQLMWLVLQTRTYHSFKSVLRPRGYIYSLQWEISNNLEQIGFLK